MPDREWQLVANAFALNAEIAAGSAPFDAVRQDVRAAGAELGKEVSKFVPQRSIRFSSSKFFQNWVK